MPRFKRLTPKQREVLEALRALGEMIVTPADARPLKNLKRRGLVRYRLDDTGGRVAVLRESKRARRRRSSEARWISRLWEALHEV